MQGDSSLLYFICIFRLLLTVFFTRRYVITISPNRNTLLAFFKTFRKKLFFFLNVDVDVIFLQTCNYEQNRLFCMKTIPGNEISTGIYNA